MFLVPKIEEVQELFLHNNINLVFITETWLKNLVAGTGISIPGYEIKRRSTTTNRAAILSSRGISAWKMIPPQGDVMYQCGTGTGTQLQNPDHVPFHNLVERHNYNDHNPGPPI